MNNLLSPEELDNISDYWPVLERMSSQKRNALFDGLGQMKKLGVDSFAIRVIDKRGYSAMFCTNVLWPNLMNNEEAYADFRKHISSELVSLYRNNCSLTSRSGDKIDSPFLKKLQKYNQNNSIIINNFLEDEIVIIYFMAHPQRPQDRDIIMNNLQQLNFIKKTLEPSLKEIVNSPEFCAKKELLLHKIATNVIWEKDVVKDRGGYFSLFGRDIDLTTRELENLYLMRSGASNKFIAEELGVSAETVKRQIYVLKNKLQVNSKKKLVELARDESLTNVLNIIGNKWKIKN